MVQVKLNRAIREMKSHQEILDIVPHLTPKLSFFGRSYLVVNPRSYLEDDFYGECKLKAPLSRAMLLIQESGRERNKEYQFPAEETQKLSELSLQINSLYAQNDRNIESACLITKIFCLFRWCVGLDGGKSEWEAFSWSLSFAPANQPSMVICGYNRSILGAGFVVKEQKKIYYPS